MKVVVCLPLLTQPLAGEKKLCFRMAAHKINMKTVRSTDAVTRQNIYIRQSCSFDSLCSNVGLGLNKLAQRITIYIFTYVSNVWMINIVNNSCLRPQLEVSG